MFRILFLLIAIQFSVLAFNQQKADSLYSRAEAFKKNSMRDSAIYYYQLAASAYLKSDSIQKAVNAYNLAGVSLTRSDKYVEAKTMLDSAFLLNKENSRMALLNRATTHISYGVIFNAEDAFDQSLNHHFASLEIRLKILGMYHSDVATSYGNIGNVYYNASTYDSAFYFHALALEIRDSLFGPQSAETIQSYLGLGNASRELKNHEKAFVYFEAALANKIIQRGDAHADLIPIYEKLIEVALLENDAALAEKYQLKVNALKSSQPD